MDVIDDLVPYAHVADIERSISFYQRLGFDISRDFWRSGLRVWAMLECRQARLMVAVADSPIDPDQQAILFYVYSGSVRQLRDSLAEHSIALSPISHPDHMPNGEFRIVDPDGYVILVGQINP